MMDGSDRISFDTKVHCQCGGCPVTFLTYEEVTSRVLGWAAKNGIGLIVNYVAGKREDITKGNATRDGLRGVSVMHGAIVDGHETSLKNLFKNHFARKMDVSGPLPVITRDDRFECDRCGECPAHGRTYGEMTNKMLWWAETNGDMFIIQCVRYAKKLLNENLAIFDDARIIVSTYNGMMSGRGIQAPALTAMVC